jgi:hypothetical protein
LKRSASMGSRGATMRTVSMTGSPCSGTQSNRAATGRSHPDGFTFRRRMGLSGHWASPRWRTRSSSRRWSRC